MDDIICPYCGYEQEADGADWYEDGEEQVVECEDCKKKFIVEVEHTIEFYPRMADCLNGGDNHDMGTVYTSKGKIKKCCNCGYKEADNE